MDEEGLNKDENMAVIIKGIESDRRGESIKAKEG